jgi:hypothetical protein
MESWLKLIENHGFPLVLAAGLLYAAWRLFNKQERQLRRLQSREASRKKNLTRHTKPPKMDDEDQTPPPHRRKRP